MVRQKQRFELMTSTSGGMVLDRLCYPLGLTTVHKLDKGHFKCFLPKHDCDLCKGLKSLNMMT